MSIPYQKQQLRQYFKEEVSKPQRAKNSLDQAVFDRFFSLPMLADASSICIYVSKPDEVTTHHIIKKLIVDKHTVAVPKVQPENQLTLHRIRSMTELVLGAFDVLEPRENTQNISPDKIDLFVVPGLFFDSKGNRLGRGPGYYDRLLEHTQATKLGLAYEWQIIDKVPVDEHDIPMDLIITKSHTIKPSTEAQIGL